MEKLMHTEHFGIKIKADSPAEKLPDGAIAVKNVSGRTLQIGKPAVTLYPGEEGAFCADAKGLQSAISSKALKSISVHRLTEVQEVKESSSKKKKQQVNEELAPEVETVLETVASDAPETSVQLGVVDVESLPSEQQEGN
jgi:hypothetical protein